MQEFKQYLEKQLPIIEIELKNIITEINKVPDPSKINISIYGKKEEIKKEYKKNVKTNFIKTIIGPSLSDLQIYVRNKEIHRLNTLKSSFERKIKQISQALEKTDKNKINDIIWPNDEIIKLILEYATINNINPEEVLDYLVQLCKYSKDTDKVEDRIKNNISRFFDNDNTLSEETKTSTIILLFEKLFITTLNQEEQKNII